MKKLVIPIITFAMGLAVGITAMLYVVRSGPNQVVETLIFQGGIEENVIYGTLLHDKKYQELQAMMEQGMDNSLSYIVKAEMLRKSKEPATKLVRGYYDATGRSIPISTEQLIKNIPAGKGSNTRRLAEASLSLTLKK